MPRSLRDKALAAISEDRITVVKATSQGIAIDVLSSKPDPTTLSRATYRTAVYIDAGRIMRQCSCPAPKRCYHVAAAELLWRPGHIEMSSR